MKTITPAVLSAFLSFVGVNAQADSPPSAAPKETPPEFSSSSLSVETDAPGRAETSNHQLTLPRVIVDGSKLPSFSEREILTKEGLSLLLSKRYPGASRPGQDPSSISNYAALMYRDDVRLARMSTMQRVVEVTKVQGDAEQAKEFKEEMDKTYLRSHDWRTVGMDRSANNWRH